MHHRGSSSSSSIHHPPIHPHTTYLLTTVSYCENNAPKSPMMQFPLLPISVQSNRRRITPLLVRVLLASSPFHSYVQIRHFLEKKKSSPCINSALSNSTHTLRRLRSLSRWRSIKKSILCFLFCHLSCPCHMMPLPTLRTQLITPNVVWSCQEDRKKLRTDSSSSPEPRRLPSLGHSQGVGLSFLACFQNGWEVPQPSCHLAKTLTTPSPPALITSLPS